MHICSDTSIDPNSLKRNINFKVLKSTWLKPSIIVTAGTLIKLVSQGVQHLSYRTCNLFISRETIDLGLDRGHKLFYLSLLQLVLS